MTSDSESDPLCAVAVGLRAGELAGWSVGGGGGTFWRHYTPPGCTSPEMGTKIHVSASIGSAAEVLARCATVCVDHKVAFKHVADLKRLSFLSSGRGGYSQVGKFITVYPPDDGAARRIAKALHEATFGLGGPRVPHEPQYADGSLISSRYGAFSQHWLQMPTGRVLPAIRRAGRWEVDQRASERRGASVGAVHPQTVAPRQARPRLLRDKYVRVRSMFSSAKGSTHLGFLDDACGAKLVMIKEAYAHTMEDLRGVDAQRRLRDEAQWLVELGPARIAPEFIDYWETRDSAFLVYKPIEGATLSSVLATLARHGLRPSHEIVRSWAASLCTIVDKLHRHGLVSCDIKPSNLVVTPDGFFLIDLELAGPPTDVPTGSIGTRGYSSPQQTSLAHGRSTADDVFAIGATLLSMATLTDAAILPDVNAVAGLEAVSHPDDPVYDVVMQCLRDEPTRRPPSAMAIAAALAQPVRRRPRTAKAVPEAYLGVAVEIGERIVACAAHADAAHSYWLSHHSSMNGQAVRDLYSGSAGIALYLCALFGETRETTFLNEAHRCGAWLWESEPPVPRASPMPGLYFGECGAGLVYLKLYLLSRDVKWLQRAEAVADQVQTSDVASPDIMTGLAGVGLFHLAVWRASGSATSLVRANDCALEILRRRELDRPVWRFPDDYDMFGGSSYAGFAHGSAGIGYFLAELVAATGQMQYRRVCREIADWLLDLAEPALVDGSGLTWPASDARGSSIMTTWCHGAPGIARFLLRAYDVTTESGYLDAALRAVRMVAKGAPWAGSTQCHGLAGNLEAVMDAFLRTGSPDHLQAARALGAGLRSYETPGGWLSDELSTGCLDLMLGEAGIGAAFLRLANPQMPHIVSCAAFEP